MESLSTEARIVQTVGNFLHKGAASADQDVSEKRLYQILEAISLGNCQFEETCFACPSLLENYHDLLRQGVLERYTHESLLFLLIMAERLSSFLGRPVLAEDSSLCAHFMNFVMDSKGDFTDRVSLMIEIGAPNSLFV